MMLYERVLVLRGALLPWWTGTIRLNGIEHVHAALEAGHGAILWVHECLGSNVSVKQALFEAGLPLAHLSRPSHPLGVRLANPLLRHAENRFLAERVVIDEGRTVAPLRRLHVLLSKNRVISVTVASTASRVRSFPILGGSVLLPDGPVKIAAGTGAAILPVFTGGSDWLRVVEIGPPLPVTGSDPSALRACQQASVNWLEERIAEHPAAWTGWRSPPYHAVFVETDERR